MTPELRESIVQIATSHGLVGIDTAADIPDDEILELFRIKDHGLYLRTTADTKIRAINALQILLLERLIQDSEW